MQSAALLFERQSERTSLFPSAASVCCLSLYHHAFATHRTYVARFHSGCVAWLGCRLRCRRSFRFGGSFPLGLLFHVLFSENRDASVGVVAQYVVYDGGNLLLQFADKLSRVVSLVLDVAQFLLPYSRQLTALEQFLLDEVDEFDACSRSHEVFLSLRI